MVEIWFVPELSVLRLLLIEAEITRTNTQDPSHDTLPSATHDLKLTWSFLQNGFISSPFLRHFPNILKRPPDEVLPADLQPNPHRHGRPLEEVLRETMSRLLQAREAVASPVPVVEESLSSQAMSESIDVEPTEIASVPSSPDTVDRPLPVEEQPVKRRLEKEPWVWANTLVRELERLVGGAVKSKEARGRTLATLDPGGEGIFVCRMVEGVSTRWEES